MTAATPVVQSDGVRDRPSPGLRSKAAPRGATAERTTEETQPARRPGPVAHRPSSSPGPGAQPRIAFFTESMLPLVDGVSHSLSHLFDSLHAAGVPFRCFAPFAPAGGVPWADAVRRVRSFAFPLHRGYRVSVPGGRRLVAEIEDFAPDLVHVVSPTPMGLWAQRFARRRGLPVVGTFHTDFVAYFRYYHLGALERLGWRLLRGFYGRCTATFAPSPSTVEELRARGFTNVRLWSRGVDAVRFSPARRDPALRASLGADAAHPIVLLVSRLVKEKNLAQLVAADRLLRARGFTYRLALVGDGPERRNLVRALPHAHFAGHQTGADLARFYASADVFVLPSTTETFANVVQEAMASGLPAVVADRGGPPGVIEPGRSGLVARADDATALADCVAVLLADPERREAMGRAAREQAEQRTWEAVNEVLLREYQALAARSEAPVRARA